MKLYDSILQKFQIFEFVNVYQGRLQVTNFSLKHRCHQRFSRVVTDCYVNVRSKSTISVILTVAVTTSLFWSNNHNS